MASSAPVIRRVRTQTVVAGDGVVRFVAVGTEWHASVRADDAPARMLCEQLGMRGERASLLRLPWAAIGRLPAELASVVDDAPAADDDIERAFGWPAGRVAMARPGRVLVHLRDHALAIAGFAAFDPARAVVSPLRVTRPALATALLAALRRHARPGDVQLVIDADAPLEAMLRNAGAIVDLALVHYSGERITTAADVPFA